MKITYGLSLPKDFFRKSKLNLKTPLAYRCHKYFFRKSKLNLKTPLAYRLQLDGGFLKNEAIHCYKHKSHCQIEPMKITLPSYCEPTPATGLSLP
jgi:hypothetical protein